MKKKPSPKPDKKPVAKAEKAATGKLAQREAAPAPRPLLWTYSQQEKFLWLKDAALLQKARGSYELSRSLKADGEIDASLSPQIQDYFKVFKSRSVAGEILANRQRSELLPSDIRKRAENPPWNEWRPIAQKVALQQARAYGSVNFPDVRLAIADAQRYPATKAEAKSCAEFFIKLGKALATKKRPKIIDYENPDFKLPAFLVLHWCGDRRQVIYDNVARLLESEKIGSWRNGVFLWKKYEPVSFMPPLCFFSPKALGLFCAKALGESWGEKYAQNVRGWVSRLQLHQACTPEIRAINEPCTEGKESGADRIYFDYVCD